jgi:hypothetical protein
VEDVDGDACKGAESAGIAIGLRVNLGITQ